MNLLFIFGILLLSVNTLAIDLVKWDIDESINRISRLKYKRDFFSLSNHFEPQVNKLYCGSTTAVIILNAFELRKNKDHPSAKYNYDSITKKLEPTKWNPEFKKYNQENIFKKGIKDKALVLG